MKDYFLLAFKSLTQRRLRSWLTMIGIFIGIAAVVSLLSLGQGLQEAVYQQFAALGANTITVQAKGGGFGPPGTLAATNITEQDLARVKRVSGVQRAFGRLVRPAEVEFNSARNVKKFIYIGSFPKEPEDREFLITARDMQIQDGRMLDKRDKFKVIIGNKYNREEIFGRELVVGDKLTINDFRVEIVGVLARTGSPEVDIAFFLNEDPFEDVFDIKDEYDVIIARASKGRSVETVSEGIKQALRRFRNVDKGEEDFTVETSEDLLNTFNSILAIIQTVLVGIAGISLFVGGIGITNTMYTSVLERTKEIGIMKAVGARNRDIMIIFLIESGLLGLAGGVIGVIIGIGLSKAVEYGARAAGISLLQAYFPWYLILGSLAFSFIVGSLSGLMPAKRASAMHPAEALRQ